MALPRLRLAIRRSGSVKNKLKKIAWNIFGWTPVILIRQTSLNSRRLSSLYFVNIVTRLDAMFISQMFQIPNLTLTRN
jgi:hypothetical protein